MELSPLIRPADGAKFRNGEFEPTAAVFAVMQRPGKNGRNIILRTGNQNALRLEESARDRAPAAGRILLARTFFFLTYRVGIPPAYVRSGHNSTADGF